MGLVLLVAIGLFLRMLLWSNRVGPRSFSMMLVITRMKSALGGGCFHVPWFRFRWLSPPRCKLLDCAVLDPFVPVGMAILGWSVLYIGGLRVLSCGVC